MNERLTQMIDFITPILKSQDYSFDIDQQENSILHIYSGNQKGILGLHYENAPHLRKLIGQMNNQVQSGQEEFVGHIFYKEKDAFLINAAQYLRNWKKGRIAGKSPYSLGNFSEKQLADGAQLSPAEQEAKIQYRQGAILNYYQPETKRLEEAVRTYKIEPITFYKNGKRLTDKNYAVAPRISKSNSSNVIIDPNTKRLLIY